MLHIYINRILHYYYTEHKFWYTSSERVRVDVCYAIRLISFKHSALSDLILVLLAFLSLRPTPDAELSQ